jgi:hypothetical protein
MKKPPRKKKLHELTPPKIGNRSYFTADTQRAIVLYNASTSDAERNFIYETHLAYPLNKLVESIINRFKFPYIDSNFDDLKAEVVSTLVLVLGRFQEGKGLAYSYLSVIAKNHLIQRNDSAYTEEKQFTSILPQEEAGLTDSVMFDAAQLVITPVDETAQDIKEFTKLMIEFWDKHIKTIFKKKRDEEIANAIVELMRGCATIENFNKKLLFIFIREQTNCKAPQITKVINKMKKYMHYQLRYFMRHGVIANNLVIKNKPT